MTAPSVKERNHADPARYQFSVLCWRGWCDYEFMIRDVANMLAFVTVTGIRRPLPAHLPQRECPSPGTCQCACHDAERAIRAQLNAQLGEPR